MSAKHTATPWVVATNAGGPETLIRAGNERTGRRIADTFASQPSAKTREGYIASRKENEANAEFIVRACNAHDDLVKALQVFARLANQFEDGPGGHLDSDRIYGVDGLTVGMLRAARADLVKATRSAA